MYKRMCYGALIKLYELPAPWVPLVEAPRTESLNNSQGFTDLEMYSSHLH